MHEMTTAAAAGTANGARPSEATIVSVDAAVATTGKRSSRHGRGERSSTGPRSGPVTGWGNVVMAIQPPRSGRRAGSVEGEEDDGERQPSLTSRAHDSLMTNRGSNVFKQ